MINLSKIKKKCYACGACINICHSKAINMHEDEYGFSYPKIDLEKCIECGLCEKVCPINSNPQNTPIIAFTAAWNNKNIIKCASGGMFASMATYIIFKGGVVFGCAMEKIQGKYKPIIKSANNLKDLQPLLGSKYVQADTQNTYYETQKLLKKGIQVLYSGTPCQISGLKNYLQRNYDNLITIDIICHGTPNTKIFQSYISYIEKKKKVEIQSFNFRDKSKGWGYYYNYTTTNKKQKIKTFSHHYNRSIYYQLFLSSAICCDSCYECPYATIQRISDITIGDCWGIEKEYPELDINKGGDLNFSKGISCVLINSPKGKKFWSEAQGEIISHPININRISKYNHQLSYPSHLHPLRSLYLDSFRKKGYQGMRNLFYKKRWKSLIKEFLLGWISQNMKRKIKLFIK